jgi:hypothetical protein
VEIMESDTARQDVCISALPKDDRRRGHDRRSGKHSPELPFYDSSGTKVSSDRSRRADRRLNSIAVKWLNESRELLP